MIVDVNSATFDFPTAIADVKMNNSAKAINKLLAFGKIFTTISAWQISEDGTSIVPVFEAPKGYKEITRYKNNNIINIVYKKKGTVDQYVKLAIKVVEVKQLSVSKMSYESRFNFEVVIGLNGLTFCFDKKVTEEEVMRHITNNDVKTIITA